MKPTLVILFMAFSVGIFCQTKDEGLWILRNGFPDTFYVDGLYPDDRTSADTAYTPFINDSIFARNTYRLIPHAIKFEKYNILLIYGDITDMNARLIVKSRNLYTYEGDCIFAWEPSSQMYEYVATWNQDHYAYFFEDGLENVYENLDIDILSQQQKERIVPRDENDLYWQGRLRPIKSYYRCNIPSKN